MSSSVMKLFKKAKKDNEFKEQLNLADDSMSIDSFFLSHNDKCVFAAVYEGYLVGKHGPAYAKQIIEECKR